jgi:hypothetical protein
MIEPGLVRLTYALQMDGLCPQEVAPEHPERAKQHGMGEPKVVARAG